MSVFLLTKEDQIKACTELARYMERTSSEVVIFTNSKKFYSSVEKAQYGDIEYVMIDVRTFQIDEFNPYIRIAESCNPVPVIVFNDPFPEPESRASYWLYKNKIYMLSSIGIKKLELMLPVFALLETYFNKYKLSHYFKCICPPEKLLSITEKNRKDTLEQFPVKHKLSKSRKLLFDIFLENEGKELSEEIICNKLWKDFSDRSRQNLYSYVSELRKACREEDLLKINILRKSKGIYQMSIDD